MAAAVTTGTTTNRETQTMAAMTAMLRWVFMALSCCQSGSLRLGKLAAFSAASKKWCTTSVMYSFSLGAM